MTSIDTATQLFLDGKYTEALAAFDQALLECTVRRARPRADAPSLWVQEEQKPVVHANRGAALMSIGSVEEAVKSFDEALAIDPDHIESLHNKGVALSELERFEEAVKCFERVTVLSPQFFAAHAGLSEALSNQGRHEDAVKAAQRAIAVDSSTPVGFTDKAFALLKLKRFRDANEAYASAVKCGDSSAETSRLYSISLSQEALDLEAEGKPAQALELLNKSVEMYASASGFHNRGIILLQLEKLQEALASFRRAVEMNPEYFESLSALGALCAQEDNLKPAHEYLSRALKIDAKSTETRFNLGVTKIKMEDVEGARQEWKTVLLHEPGEPNATAALKILDEWLTRARDAGSDGKAEAKQAAKHISSLNAPPSGATASPPRPAATKLAAPAPKHGIQDPAKLLQALDLADAALSAAGEHSDDASSSTGGGARRKSVFDPQAGHDIRRTYVRDISAAPDSAATALRKGAAPSNKPQQAQPPSGRANDDKLFSALSKLDEELAAKGQPRRGSVVAPLPAKVRSVCCFRANPAPPPCRPRRRTRTRRSTSCRTRS
jgi:tetratricopeptide (TPR) repeat protein